MKPAYCPRCDRPFDDSPTVLDALKVHEKYAALSAAAKAVLAWLDGNKSVGDDEDVIPPLRRAIEAL